MRHVTLWLACHLSAEPLWGCVELKANVHDNTHDGTQRYFLLISKCQLLSKWGCECTVCTHNRGKLIKHEQLYVLICILQLTFKLVGTLSWTEHIASNLQWCFLKSVFVIKGVYKVQFTLRNISNKYPLTIGWLLNTQFSILARDEWTLASVEA